MALTHLGHAECWWRLGTLDAMLLQVSLGACASTPIRTANRPIGVATSRAAVTSTSMHAGLGRPTKHAAAATVAHAATDRAPLTSEGEVQPLLPPSAGELMQEGMAAHAATAPPLGDASSSSTTAAAEGGPPQDEGPSPSLDTVPSSAVPSLSTRPKSPKQPKSFNLSYRAAGVLPYCFNPEDGQLYVLMLREKVVTNFSAAEVGLPVLCCTRDKRACNERERVAIGRASSFRASCLFSP